MTLARLISEQKRAVLVLIALLCAAGIYAAWQLPSAIFPQTDFPRIIIIVDNGVVPAQQTLVTVTRPIEEAMNGIPGITRIRSTTQRGSCDINLFFAWNVDIKQSLQLVQARLSQLTSQLPPTAEIRRVDRLTFAVFPVVGYALLRPHVSSDATALAIVLVFPVAEIVFERLRRGRFEPIGIIALVGITLGLLGALAFNGDACQGLTPSRRCSADRALRSPSRADLYNAATSAVIGSMRPVPAAARASRNSSFGLFIV